MQREENILAADIACVIRTACEEPIYVYESYSAFDTAIIRLSTMEEVLAYVNKAFAAGSKYIELAFHCQAAHGVTAVNRIKFDPAKCNGATGREKIVGWGLIYIRFTLLDNGLIACRVAVNTEKRAIAWLATYPEMGEPNAWNWKAVERHARRIIRSLRTCASNCAPL